MIVYVSNRPVPWGHLQVKHKQKMQKAMKKVLSLLPVFVVVAFVVAVKDWQNGKIAWKCIL